MSESISEMDLLTLMSDHIRSVYIQCRRFRPGQRGFTVHPKWDGGKDSRGRQYKPIWPKIARFMFEHRLDVSACLLLRFELATEKQYPPNPDDVATPRYLEDYKAVSQETVADLGFMLNAEKELCLVEISEANASFSINGKPAWIMVLGNDDLALSPLFRYCLASSEGLTDLVKKNEIEAILQYIVSTRGYDKAWAEWIPTKFKKQVKLALDRTVLYRKDDDGKEDSKTKGRREATSDR